MGGSRPSLVVVAEPENYWVACAFARYANVALVLVDSRHSLPDKLRRLGVRAATKYLRPLEGLWYRVARRALRPRGLDLESVDAVVAVEVHFPLERPPELRGATYVLWSHDSHVERTFEIHLSLARHGWYDVVYATHSQAVKRFREAGVEARHLPYAANTAVFYPRPVDLEPGPFFVGTLTAERARVLEEASRRLREVKGVEIEVVRAWQHDYSELVSKRLLAVNVSRRREVNWRVFEVLASRGLLLSDRSPELLEYFTPGVHLDVYGDPEELAEKIAYYLDHIDEALEIARRGCEAVWREHTIDHRVCIILQDLGFPCNPRSPNLEWFRRLCLKAEPPFER